MELKNGIIQLNLQPVYCVIYAAHTNDLMQTSVSKEAEVQDALLVSLLGTAIPTP